MMSKCVNQQILTPSEEEQLVMYLKKLYAWGFPCHINEISQYAETILQQRVDSESSTKLGKNWSS